MTYLDLLINYHYEGFSAVQIHKKLVDLFKEKAPAYSTVTKKVRALSFNQTVDSTESFPPSQIDFSIASKISSFLDFYPHSSVRFISTHINVPPTTVYRYLIKVLEYKCVHLRWIPYKLTEAIRQKRVETSKELLKVLKKNKKTGFIFFSTGDECWFSYEYYPETQWIKNGDLPPERVNRSLFTKKIMITIFWSANGIHVIDVLDEDKRMNSEYFISNVLVPITKCDAYKRAKKENKKFTLHMDNCKVHKSKKTLAFLNAHEISIAPHPPYSPDLAGSDFFLFGALKNTSEILDFASPDEILSYIKEKFSTFSLETLNNVFLEWEKRLNWVIENNGDYYRPS